MSGLDLLLKAIEDESRQICEKTISVARMSADEITGEAVSKGKKRLQKSIDDAKRDAALEEEKAYLSGKALYDKILLEEKNKLINDVIDEAKQRLIEMDGEDFAEMILNIAYANVQNSSGIMHIYKGDMAKLPDNFSDMLNKKISSKGASLKIIPVEKDMGGGFILEYGDIRQNCTFTSLIDDNIDEIRDIVAESLFD